MGTMAVDETYEMTSAMKTHECATVFQTTEHEHPGVAMVMSQGDFNLAGRYLSRKRVLKTSTLYTCCDFRTSTRRRRVPNPHRTSHLKHHEYITSFAA
jgi:ATP sulfurylase